MKIIELLNKIANGEEVPKNIKVFDEEFNYDGYDYYSIHSSSPLMSYVGADYLRAEMNYDIEIIEEYEPFTDEILKLPYYSLEKIRKAKNKDEWREERISLLEKRVDDYHKKINEIIDKINEENK